MRENLLSYTALLLKKELPFLLIRQVNSDTVRILSQRDQKWHKSAPDNMAYGVFSKFQKSEDQVFIVGQEDKSFTYKKTSTTSKELLNAVRLVDILEQKRYTSLVAKAVLRLQESSLKKVVLSRKQSFQNSKSDIDILTDLLDAYPAANCYFFYHPQVGKWVGATPEVLVQIDGVKLKTMSLAGTALYQENEEHVWGKKELEEQRLVTDFIIRNLQDCGADNIQETEVKTVRAGKLIHLRTDITATVNLEDKNIFIDALHPTPAVCGMPRNTALEFINKNENYDRSFYTGYLGMIDKERASYFVNLRCMELEDGKVEIYVGGGVTALSDPKAEFEETLNKLSTMKKLV
ncbi:MULTISPECIES: isochorismate synthase [Nonlabens]|uniref:isochorismate synthase n=1 Tax=Nonlabens TaxID=363408 RepID=UPI003263BF18